MKKYPEYKDSGIDWLGDIPEHWNPVSGRYLYNALGGVSPEELQFVDEDGLLYYKVDDLSYGNGFFLEGSKNKINKNYPVFNEPPVVLFPKRGAAIQLNKVKISYIRCVFDTNTMGLRIFQKGLNIKYLAYYIKNRGLWDIADTSTIPQINNKHILPLKVLFPPFSEQTAIANFLDHKTQQIDDLIERKKRLIELLKEERTAVINHAVTKGLDPNVPMKDSGIEWLGKIPKHWETRRLATMGRFSKGRGISRDEIVDDGIPCIRYGEIYTQYDRIVRHPISRITEESSKKSEKIQKGDVLFTASGETIEDIGKSIVYYGDQDIYVGGDIIILKLYPNISPLFMSFSLESNYAVQQKASFGKGGIIVHIYAKQLREIFVPFPPIIEQEKIAEFLEMRTNQIDEQIRLLKDEIELFAEYKTSLINEAVTGKIKVPDAD